MGDDYQSKWRDDLEDVDPLPPPCSCCRGYRLMRGETCPECAGTGTLEGQQSHLAMLVECAAAEKEPRGERGITTVEELAKGMGGTILDLFRMQLGPGDVLVWRTRAPHRNAARFVRSLRDWLPPEHRPSAFCILRPGENLDAFNVPNMSDAGIETGLRELGDRLEEIRPAPLGSGGITIPEPEKPNMIPCSVEGIDLANPSIQQIVRTSAELAGYELTKLPTFAELMDQENTLLGRRRPGDTEEGRQRILNALKRECDIVVVQHATELFTMLDHAVAHLSEKVCLINRMMFWQMNSKTWEALDNPTALLGHHVGQTFPVPDGAILLSAGGKAENMETDRIVLVEVKCELHEVEAFVAGELHIKPDGELAEVAASLPEAELEPIGTMVGSTAVEPSPHDHLEIEAERVTGKLRGEDCRMDVLTCGCGVQCQIRVGTSLRESFDCPGCKDKYMIKQVTGVGSTWERVVPF
jgi:hypothetical protein